MATSPTEESKEAQVGENFVKTRAARDYVQYREFLRIWQFNGELW